MDSVLPPLETVIGRSLIGAEALLSEIRELLAKELGEQWDRQPSLGAISETARRVLDRFQPLLIDHLTDTDLAAWVTGFDTLSKQFPGWLVDEFQTGIRANRSFQPPTDPPRIRLFDMFENEPRLRFPLIENAAARLFERNILTRSQWNQASDEARQRAFMITGDISAETIEDVRNILAENIDRGTSLRGFRQAVQDTLESSGIGPARIETIYRTNVQASFRDGRESLASDPIVSEVFPYQQYLAIHDRRTRSHHLELESLGLDGTNVYRRDDPFWDLWTPPNGYNCRCGVRLMTVEAAARAGVREAQEWLRTGRPPESPEYRYQAIPFVNEPGFGSRGRVGVLV
jgi:SPP1 gp7 family putative phage head morphogenesis protein